MNYKIIKSIKEILVNYIFVKCNYLNNLYIIIILYKSKFKNITKVTIIKKLYNKNYKTI